MYIKHTRLPEIIVRFFVCLAVAGFAATITCGAAEKVEASPTPLVKAGNETADRSEMELAAKLVRLAARIPFIDSGTVVYQRPPMDARFFMDERERAAFDEFMALAEAADERQLWKLTAHPDPRTRTLAMIGTSWRGNPERLAGLHELTKDKAKTFPSLVYLGANMPSQQGPVEERRRTQGMTEQTVSDIAWQIVGAYLAIAQVPADQFHSAYWPARRVWRGWWGQP